MTATFSAHTTVTERLRDDMISKEKAEVICESYSRFCSSSAKCEDPNSNYLLHSYLPKDGEKNNSKNIYILIIRNADRKSIYLE